MSGLSEAELHVQAMRLVCEALQDREQDGLEVDWDVIRQMHDQMDAMLQALQHRHRYDSSEIVDLRKDRDHWRQARQEAHEAGELMRAEIETLRQELADAKRDASDEFTERQVLTVEQQQDAAAWQQQVDSANAEVSYLRARLDEERSVSARLRRQLDEARAEVETLREQLADAQLAVSDAFADVNSVRQQLNAAQAAVTLQRAGIERLHKFVAKVRLAMWPEDIKSALAELDAEPTPVAERCPECDGSGMVDSGGFGPDGKGINVPCGGDCRGNPCPSQPTPVAETEGGA